MQLVRPQPIVFTDVTRVFRSPRVVVNALTSLMVLELQRPTTLAPLAWAADTTIQTALVLVIDGVEHRVTGRARGGIKQDQQGVEIPVYRLQGVPMVQFGDKAKEYIRTATKDETGFYRNVPLTRIGETATSVVEAYIELIASGPAVTAIQLAETQEAPAPILARHHNSVAFDAATDAQEESGDGTLTLSHTSTGDDRAVRACTFIITTADSTTLTYGGTGMTAEHASLSVQSDFGIRAWRLAGQATGAQTVSSSGTPGDFIKHALNVVSFTGVDQTTPVGTSVTAQGTTTDPTLTVTGTVTDGMVVDFVAVLSPGTLTVGANQTQRNANDMTGPYLIRDSTQSSNDGGVMSWTDGSRDYWGQSAVEFKPAAGGGGRTTKNTRSAPLGVEIGMDWRSAL